MTRRVVEKLFTKKVCVDFLAPIRRLVLPNPGMQGPVLGERFSLPVVQMALQTEKNYFQINYAFHSRYRYRPKLF